MKYSHPPCPDCGGHVRVHENAKLSNGGRRIAGRCYSCPWRNTFWLDAEGNPSGPPSRHTWPTKEPEPVRGPIRFRHEDIYPAWLSTLPVRDCVSLRG